MIWRNYHIKRCIGFIWWLIILASRYLYDYLMRCRLLFLVGMDHKSEISGDLNLKGVNNLKLGKNIRIGPRVTIGAMCVVEIGDNTVISERVIIETAKLSKFNQSIHECSPIQIGKDVWIGARAIVLAGAIIPDGSIVPAHTVVKRGIFNANE